MGDTRFSWSQVLSCSLAFLWQILTCEQSNHCWGPEVRLISGPGVDNDVQQLHEQQEQLPRHSWKDAHRSTSLLRPKFSCPWKRQRMRQKPFICAGLWEKIKARMFGSPKKNGLLRKRFNFHAEKFHWNSNASCRVLPVFIARNKITTHSSFSLPSQLKQWNLNYVQWMIFKILQGKLLEHL